MKCSIKNCKSYSRSGCNVHFFGFPLNDENRLDKWIAAVGKPDWTPKKTSRICSLHFSESDIIQNVGFQRFNLHKSAIPKDNSSIVTEEEKDNIGTKAAVGHDGSSDTDQLVQNAISPPNKEDKFVQTDLERINDWISKSANFNEAPVSDESAWTWDHNYSKDNDSIVIKNDGSDTVSTRSPNQPVQKTIQQGKLIQIGLRPFVVPVSHSSTNFNFKISKEIDFINATRKIKELSKNVKDMKKKNRTLQQKFRRYSEKVILIKELFDRLQQEKLISGDSLQLVKKQLERLTLRTFKSKIKNEDQLKKEVKEN